MKCERKTDQHDKSVGKRKKKQKKILVGDFFFVPRSCQVDKFTFHISLILKVVYTDKT